MLDDRPVSFVGAHTFGFAWDIDAAEATRRLIGAGFSHIQYLAACPHFDAWDATGTGVSAVRRALLSGGATALAVDLPSSETNLASVNPEVVRFSLDAYLKVLDRAADLGARWVTVNGGRRHGLLPPPDNRLMSILAGAMETLSRTAERRGVRLLIENIPGSLLATTPEIAAFLSMAGLPNIDVLYDVANAAAAGEQPVDGIAALAPNIGLVHLSDAPKGAWKHDVIGSGQIDFGAIRAELVRQRYAGGAVVEIISRNALGDLRASRQTLVESGW